MEDISQFGNSAEQGLKLNIFEANYLQPTHSKRSPEQTLICEVIIRAVLDVKKMILNHDDWVNHRDALGWLRSDSRKPWSLLWGLEQVLSDQHQAHEFQRTLLHELNHYFGLCNKFKKKAA
jgi:hypothetical protein